ncbi:hypothetical protein Tco_0948008 [Tanacetum coccineum]
MTNAVHAPAMAPPVCTDEQILPRIRWVPIGKSNCYLNEEKSQPSPIFKIAVDILKQTNFWDTICFDSKAGSYKCQLDEQWFALTQDTHRDALRITPVDKNQAFSSPPTPDTLIKFVNELGYPREEEFTQSIHNFTEDKRNLAQQAQGKKKATLILIPSIRFTKLIIFHLQRLHNFHPRPESPLHLLTEEHVLGEEVSDLDSPAPKPAKPAKQTKPKPTKQSKPTEPKAASKKPKPAPTKPQEKKRKPVSKSSEAPPLAKRAMAGKVVKKRTLKSSKQLVDEFIVEGVPAAKHRLEDTKEAILQKVLEESLTDAYPTQRGPLPPVVFRETDTGKHKPLPEVPGKGKEKVESDEEMPSVVRSGAQDEGQAGPDPGKLTEGQAGPNPDDVAESQPLPTPSVLAGPNLEHSDVEITDPSSQPQYNTLCFQVIDDVDKSAMYLLYCTRSL